MNQCSVSRIAWLKLAMVILGLTIGLASERSLLAQGKAAAVRELVEFLSRQFSKEVAQEGTEALTIKVESAVVKYGDDAVQALRKVGPRSLSLIDNAAGDGAMMARLLAKHGDEAIWVAGNPVRRTLATKLGDDAAEAMIKHGEIAEPILEAGGKSAASALRSISTANARRISMMSKDGELANIGRTSELMDVVGKFGDRAMDFIWKNKGALAIGTALAAFLADPEPFLNGTKDLAQVAATSMVQPIANEIGARTNWTLILIVFTVSAFLFFLIKPRLLRPWRLFRWRKSSQ